MPPKGLMACDWSEPTVPGDFSFRTLSSADAFVGLSSSSSSDAFPGSANFPAIPLPAHLIPRRGSSHCDCCARRARAGREKEGSWERKASAEIRCLDGFLVSVDTRCVVRTRLYKHHRIPFVKKCGHIIGCCEPRISSSSSQEHMRSSLITVSGGTMTRVLCHADVGRKQSSGLADASSSWDLLWNFQNRRTEEGNPKKKNSRNIFVGNRSVISLRGWRRTTKVHAACLAYRACTI